MKHKLLPVKIALQELRHGWRHFALVVACIILGVAVMAAIGTLSAGIENGLQKEAQSLLGGDVEITVQGGEATEEQRRLMASFGEVSHVSTLRAMAQYKENTLLVEVKAVDGHYPLLGKLELYENSTPAQALSGNGVIVDSSLMSQLGMKMGDNIKLGSGSYTITATLKKEPDRVVQLFSFGPRVLISHAALQQSELVAASSLISNHYRIVMESSKIDALKKALKAQSADANLRFKTGTDGNVTIKTFINQMVAFLTLSGVTTFLIGGVGIGSSVHAFLKKKSATIAVMKVMGASRKTLFYSYALLLAFLTLLGGSVGISLSTAALAFIVPIVGQWLPVILDQSRFDAGSSLLSLWYGLLIVYLFSLPALFNALAIRPALLFRAHSGITQFKWNILLGGMTGSIGLLLVATLFVMTRDKIFVTAAIAVILLAFVLFWLCGIGVRQLAHKIQVKKLWLKLALANLYRPGSTAPTVIFAIGISLTVLVALTLTEANFQARIARIVEEKAPSLFMIDIQPDQKERLETLLEARAGKAHVMIYPMVRGRITALNGKPVAEKDVEEEVRWAVRGDRGLSYSVLIPDNARITQGTWWPENYTGKPLLSVDERFLKGMHIALGDTITLNILGQEITATISNARHIDYTTFQINFAMMLSPGVIDEFPHSYVATLHLDKGEEAETALVRDIAASFPGVTVIRTREAVELVQNVMQHIATALRITVSISLFAGILVLISALSASIEQRLYDTAILKVLGAGQREILKSCTVEWMLLALVTSLIAAVIGTFGAWLIMLRFAGEGFYFMPEVTLATLLFSVLVIGVTGYIGNRQIFRIRPAQLLRGLEF